jgi:hypothetical protein
MKIYLILQSLMFIYKLKLIHIFRKIIKSFHLKLFNLGKFFIYLVFLQIEKLYFQ